MKSSAAPNDGLSARLKRESRHGGRGLVVLALVLAVLLISPVATIIATVFGGGWETFSHLASTVLPRYIANSLLLSFWVMLGTFAIGTATAWIVTTCRFPGRRVFKWALVLPLAVPAYVIAYAYTEFLSHPGPVQSLLREVTGWGPRDYWFPNVRSLGGAAMMFTLVLYPYVYLLARSAFLKQSAHTYDVARTLGRSPTGAFFAVALPLARPAIATGVALALMETLADFGTVSHFGVQTFTTGIYRAWFSIGDRVAAAQLAAVLLTFVFFVLLFERLQRSGSTFLAQGADRRMARFTLRGRAAWGAFVICLLPVLFGFVAPVLLLLELAISDHRLIFQSRYIGFALNSFTLAGFGAALTVVVALVLAYAVRLAPNRWTSLANRLASLGYAVPGSIIAVGLLIPLTRFDNGLDALMERWFGISTGLLLTGTIAALLFAYMVRFMAVALNTVEASLGKIRPTMDQAARTLGETGFGVLLRIHLPLMTGGILTAGLIVFVDIMKELPATIIMRPFNFDTLAIQAYRLAADERLAEAAIPSLTIVAVGMLPVILLSRQITKSKIT